MIQEKGLNRPLPIYSLYAGDDQSSDYVEQSPEYSIRDRKEKMDKRLVLYLSQHKRTISICNNKEKDLVLTAYISLNFMKRRPIQGTMT